ncbi:MAG: tripartite tricarboxylate transporter substrate binding protein [Xanthobacteraceae bacterium]|nr:tripartite tricarboxylate transporter substrate binding protein [Xanthobacteraceae bacterium]
MVRVLRLALIVLGVALVAGAGSGDAFAQSYPSRPLHLIVPFAPGGSPDIIGRMLAEDLAAALGQSVVVENRAGAGGNIAVQYVIDQPADGYTLLLGTSGNMASNKVLYRNLKFDSEVDLIPISVAYTTCNVLIVSASSPIRTVADLIAEAKKRPGALSFGSPGVGTAGHLIGELFKTTTDTQLTHVPYRGQSQVINDLLGGHLAMSFEVAATAIPVVESGKMRALAVTCPRRLAKLPDAPTFAEAGIQGFVLEGLALIAAHGRTPPDIVRRLNETVVKIINSPKVTERIAAMGLRARSSSPDEARALLNADVRRWSAVVKAAGIPPLD